MLNRRQQDKSDRASRIAVTATLGAPLAILFAFFLKDHWGPIPTGVEAAMGAVLGAVIACMHDVIRYVGAYIVHKLGFPPPKD